MDYDFFLTGRDEKALEETVKLIRKAASAESGSSYGCGEGPLIVLHVEDLSHKEAADRLFSAFTNSFGRLDLLVNNTGIVGEKPVGDLNINAGAPFFLMQHSILQLKKADPGFILNIGSVVAYN